MNFNYLTVVTQHILVLILIFFQPSLFVTGQTIIIPGPEIQDPFKNNPKWNEFLLNQLERVDRLKTLVNNVWTLIDTIPNPNSKSNLRTSFVKFHVPDFIEFFKETNERLRDWNPFPFISTAIGFQNMSALLNFTNKLPTDKLSKQRLRWLAIGEASFIINEVFNATSTEILNYEEGFSDRVLDAVDSEKFPLWSSKIFNTDGDGGRSTYTLDELSKAIDSEVDEKNENGRHLFRGLMDLLSTMKQSYTDTNQHLNYFCFGNNEFGVIHDVMDILGDTGTFLVMTDMKKLIMDVYGVTLNVFFKSDKVKVKDTIGNRSVIWEEMVDRINRKIRFPYLEGLGWEHSAGPVVFKCDLAPKNLLGERGQWGRNISTGISPNASPTFPYDPPAGPLKPNNTVGYIDERTPDILAVGFENIFKGYIESELALNPTSSCRDTCPIFQRPTPLCKTTPQHCPLFRESHCHSKGLNSACMKRNRCPGYAMKCKRTGREVKMCPSSENGKLYNWISFNGKLMSRNNALTDMTLEDGKIQEPDCKEKVDVAAERWEMENGVILYTPRYCELCLCTCMTPFDPDDQEYFELEPRTSNTEAGMVVSAVRFVKEGKTIRLAVEEGKPLMKGLINETTTRWIERVATTNWKTAPIGPDGFMRMNFDLLIGEAGTVVTGVRFAYNGTERSLNLEIQTTPIDWPEDDPNNITLRPTESKWISSSNFPKPEGEPREPLLFNDPGDPLSQKGPSMPDTVLNSYVEFTSSSYEKDLGQTVIPLFDSQPVFYYERRRWLRGIGIMHKGKPGSGGFITPSILPANPYKTVHYFSKPVNGTVLVV